VYRLMMKDIMLLEKVQRRATKMIDECKGKSYEERLEIVGLITLEKRRMRADLIEAFKILKGIEGIDEKLFFKRHLSNTRGHSMKLYKERVNRDVLKFSFANRVIEHWNKLPDSVVNVNSVNTFKNKLDKIFDS
jgi:hypothetical protein